GPFNVLVAHQPPFNSFSSPDGSGIIARMCSNKFGRTESETRQTCERSTPSYWWIKTSRSPAKPFHGISGCALRYESGMRLAASPLKETSLRDEAQPSYIRSSLHKSRI